MRVIGKKLDATRQTTVVASGTMPSGKPVVINSDGTASVVSETTSSSNMTYGTFTNIENEATQYVHIAADPFNSNRFAMVSVDDAGDKNVHLYIITRNGTSITVSSQLMVFASPSNNASGSMCIWDVVTEDKILICYNDDSNDFNAVVATISGSAGSESATFGTAIEASTQPFSGGDAQFPFLTPIGTTGSYLAFFRRASNSYTYWRILTISGTSVSRDTAGGTAGTVLISTVRDITHSATIDPNDSTKGFALSVKSSGEDLRGQPLTFSGTGTGMTVSGGSTRIFKSGRDFVKNQSKPFIKYITSNKLFVAALTGMDDPSGTFGDLETFLFDYDGSNYTEYTSSFLSNPDANILYHYIDTVSAQADNTKFIVTTTANSSPRYVYGAIATVDTSANTVSYNTPVRIDGFTGSANAGYVSYATQRDGFGTSLCGFSGTDSNGSQRPYVRLIQKGGISKNLDAENFVGLSQSSTSSGNSFAINTKGAVDKNQSGLTAGQSYYVQTDGTLGTTPADPSVFAGTAVSATKLIVKG